jgi:hypothetical protein
VGQGPELGALAGQDERLLHPPLREGRSPGVGEVAAERPQAVRQLARLVDLPRDRDAQVVVTLRISGESGCPAARPSRDGATPAFPVVGGDGRRERRAGEGERLVAPAGARQLLELSHQRVDHAVLRRGERDRVAGLARHLRDAPVVVERLLEPAELEAGVAEREQDAAPQRVGVVGLRRLLRAAQRAIRVTDVAAGVRQLGRLQRERPRETTLSPDASATRMTRATSSAASGRRPFRKRIVRRL